LDFPGQQNIHGNKLSSGRKTGIVSVPMKTIRSFVNQAEAGLCVTFLQANGVDAVLLDGDSLLSDGGPVFAVRLQVPEEEEGAALELLATMKEMREAETAEEL
jgi:hypothetical protein